MSAGNQVPSRAPAAEARRILLLAALGGIIELAMRAAYRRATAMEVGEAALVYLITGVVYAALVGLPTLLLRPLLARLGVSPAAFLAGLFLTLWGLAIWHTVVADGVRWHSPSSLAASLAMLAGGAAIVSLLRRIPAAAVLKPAAAVVAVLVVVIALELGYSPIRRPAPASPRSGWYLLIVVDTLAAGHTSLHGYRRETTPELERFAAQAVAFEHAVSPSSWTTPAVASLFTSLHLHRHQTDGSQVRLRQELVTLAERFTAAGFVTAGFSSNIPVSSLTGFDQGFTYFDDRAARHSPRQLVLDSLLLDRLLLPPLPALRQALDTAAGQRAARMNRIFIDWHERHRDLPGGFIYLHYFDPHDPYRPPPGYDNFGDGDVDGYDGDIRYWDRQFGELLGYLKRHRMLEHATVIVTSDHGEEFEEHGGSGHGHSLYEELVHVPLLIKTPGVEPRRVARSVSLLDVAPTLAELAGLDPLPLADGRSLVPWLQGQTPAERVVLSELHHNRGTHRVSFASHPWKLILQPASGAVELYRLDRDPLERHDLAAEHPRLVDALLDSFPRPRWSESATRPRSEDGSEPAASARELRAALKALGYLD